MFQINYIMLLWIFKNNNYTYLKSSFGLHHPKEKLNLTTDEWTKLFHTNNEKKKYIKIILKNFYII